MDPKPAKPRRMWVRLDEDTLRRFKALCADRGVTQEDGAGNAIRDAVVRSSVR